MNIKTPCTLQQRICCKVKRCHSVYRALFPEQGSLPFSLSIVKLHLGENHHAESHFSTAADPLQRSLVQRKVFASLGRA